MTKIELPLRFKRELKEFEERYALVKSIFDSQDNLQEENYDLAKRALQDPLIRMKFGDRLDVVQRRISELEKELGPQVITSNLEQNLDGYIKLPSGIYISEESFYGDKSWDAQHKAIFEDGAPEGYIALMPRAKELWELIFFCGNNLEDLTYKKIYDDFLETGDYRGQHANELFVKGSGFKGLDVVYVKGIDKKEGLDFEKESLENCVEGNCYVDISSPEYINRQGMPIKIASNQNYVPGKTIYFYVPTENSVGRFNVNSYWSYFSCDGSRGYSNPSLRVRKILKPKL